MDCYFCSQLPGPGGMAVRNIRACAVCRRCGLAICQRHWVRSGPGEPVSCPDCAPAPGAAAALDHRKKEFVR